MLNMEARLLQDILGTLFSIDLIDLPGKMGFQVFDKQFPVFDSALKLTSKRLILLVLGSEVSQRLAHRPLPFQARTRYRGRCSNFIRIEAGQS